MLAPNHTHYQLADQMHRERQAAAIRRHAVGQKRLTGATRPRVRRSALAAVALSVVVAIGIGTGAAAAPSQAPAADEAPNAVIAGGGGGGRTLIR